MNAIAPEILPKIDIEGAKTLLGELVEVAFNDLILLKKHGGVNKDGSINEQRWQNGKLMLPTYYGHPELAKELVEFLRVRVWNMLCRGVIT